MEPPIPIEFLPHRANCTNGTVPSGGLTYLGAASGALYDGASPLYGTTGGGGLHSGGVVYQLALDNGTWKETVLYDFCSLTDCADGRSPGGPLLLDADGNLYGATFSGGSGHGTIFELERTHNGWRETVLHKFCDPPPCTDGLDPEGQLAMDGNGDLFGTAILGGDNNGGVLYRLIPAGKQSQFIKLHDFCAQTDCPDGAQPANGVLISSNRDIFGVTEAGGNKDRFGVDTGVVFRLSGSKYKVIYLLCSEQPNCTDGADPNSNLISDSHGRMYGIANLGVAYDVGAVFELSR